MLQIINQPPKGSNLWTISLHVGYDDYPELPSDEFGVAAGSINDEPELCLRQFKGARVAISVCEDLPHQFNFLRFIERWFKTGRVNALGSFFIQLTRIPENNTGFPELITADHTGAIHSQEFRVGIPYPHQE